MNGYAVAIKIELQSAICIKPKGQYPRKFLQWPDQTKNPKYQQQHECINRKMECNKQRISTESHTPNILPLH